MLWWPVKPVPIGQLWAERQKYRRVKCFFVAALESLCQKANFFADFEIFFICFCCENEVMSVLNIRVSGTAALEIYI